MPVSKVRYVALFVALVLACAWFYSGAMDGAFFDYPQKPIPTEGRTVAYPVKQRIVYITPDQRRLLTALDYIEIAAAALLVIIFFAYGDAAFRNPFRPKAD